ncbi:hypothetical protein IFU39_13740 [Paenibacillus sp. CFBP 13594]|uniref:hypothetical protein n=1 Tax=Paenibacillus sp. CFBP 13594 TaxID=2774037 RepID=UPI00177FB64F|nr:hypothetical protein [Paenibacillus sp. CFBP 13594]MBD8838878.1 hypothetical protein [Paenibacillus sp. CFBP 13594]
MLNELQVEIFELMRQEIRYYSVDQIAELLSSDTETITTAVSGLVEMGILIPQDGEFIFDVQKEIETIAQICAFNRMRHSDISFLKRNKEEAVEIFESILAENDKTKDFFTKAHLSCIQELLKQI